MLVPATALETEIHELDLQTKASSEAAATHAYWASLPRINGLPKWRDFDWMNVPPRIICCCGVVDVTNDEREFVYRFWGTKHVAMHSQELTGHPVSDMRPITIRDNVVQQYRSVRDDPQPRLFVSIYRSTFSELTAREYSLRLPFSDDGAKVTHILALSDILETFENAKKVCEDPVEGT